MSPGTGTSAALANATVISAVGGSGRRIAFAELAQQEDLLVCLGGRLSVRESGGRERHVRHGTARVHHAARRRGGRVAARCARTAGGPHLSPGRLVSRRTAAAAVPRVL